MTIEQYVREHHMTYRAFSNAIYEATGRRYHIRYLHNVRKNPVSFSMAYRIQATFPDFVLPSFTPKNVKTTEESVCA